MSADTLALIYGRPFDVRMDRGLGGPIERLLEDLSARHPDMIHAPLLGSGEWWIGHELQDMGEAHLPISFGFAARGIPVSHSTEERVDHFLETLPEMLTMHPRLRPAGIYLVRRGTPRHQAAPVTAGETVAA